jgi:hypothetical protein
MGWGMIVKCTPEQRKDAGFGTYSHQALTALKGETFRVYCLILSYPTHKKDGSVWDIKPKEIAKELSIGVATVMRSFREMRGLGYMTFDVDDFGNIPRTFNAKGQVTSAAGYSFYEIPELCELKPVSKQNQDHFETGSEMKQNQDHFETGTRIILKQVPNIYDSYQTEIIQIQQPTTTDTEAVVVVEDSTPARTSPDQVTFDEQPLVQLLSRVCQVTEWKFGLLLKQHCTDLKELCHAVTYAVGTETIKNPYDWLSRGKNLFHNGQFAYTNGNAHIDVPKLFEWFQTLPSERRNQAVKHLKDTLPLEVSRLGFQRWWTNSAFHDKVQAMYEFDQRQQ